MPWELTGNTGTNPANNFLGTNDSQPLIVKTNGKEVLRISAEGSVGLRVDPTAHFHVASIVPISIGLPGSPPPTSIPQVLVTRTNQGGLGNNAVWVDFVIQNGYVGIGTASPGEKLSVAGIVESQSGGIKFPDKTVQKTAGVTPQQLATVSQLVSALQQQVNNLQQQVSTLQQQVNLNNTTLANLQQQINNVAATAANAQSLAFSAEQNAQLALAEIETIQHP